MSILFIILGVIVGIVLLIIIIASFSSSNYSIVAQMPIKRSKEDIYNYIKFLRNSEQYNKWVMMDPNMERTYTGTDGQVGFTYSWKSKNNQLGEGAQEIISMDENAQVSYSIRFIKPMQNVSQSSLILTDGEHGVTTVSWTFLGQRSLMMKVLHLVFRLENALRKDLMESLGNLKQILEK